mgnify:CR=1 FL=1
MPLIDKIDPALLKQIPNLPIDEQRKILDLIEELEEAESKEYAKEYFMGFVKRVWPAFIQGRHHKIMANAFERVASGELKRLIVNMPPRHTKSEFASYLLPSWFLGLFPNKKVIQTAHTAELSVGFGRKVRNLVDSEDYKDIFPNTVLKSDSKAAGRWSTGSGGEYFAIGVGGAVTGKGADLLIIDDTGSDEWEVIEFPAIMPSDKPLWPEFWPMKELVALREELPSAKWNAQYQQNPTSEEGALIKRNWWKIWDSGTPPSCEFVIQSWDTAFLKTQRADYSACTTWGVFYAPDDEGMTVANIILLDAFKERLEFPELKKKAQEFYTDWQPDACIIEAKAAGTPLIFELRAMGIPVSDYTPSRGNDKISRVNAVSDLFASGIVWRPERRFAEEVVEEFAAFPAGEHDDLVDSSTQALLRFRQGGFLKLRSDEEDEPVIRRTAAYY